MTTARENESGMPQPETKPASERTDTITTSSGSDHDDKAGVPRWLKIAAVAIPVFATICAGLWTISTWYVALQTSLEQEKTKQTASRAAEADSTKQAAEARFNAEKEVTRRQELLLTAEANARNDEKQLQRLKTEEQQARQAISTNEINRQVAADKTSAQIQDDAAFAALIAAVSSNVEKPDTPPSTVSLAALMRYANNSRYAEILAAALVAKSARIATLEEAQLCLRLAQAIQPLDFALVAKMNRIARRKVEDGEVQDFWWQYLQYSNKQKLNSETKPNFESPFEFLDVRERFGIYKQHLLAYEAIQRDLLEGFSPLNMSSDDIRSAIETKRNQKPMDPAVFEANSFLLEHSADTLMEYIMNPAGKFVLLDVSGCYLPREPVGLKTVRLITDKTFFGKPSDAR